MKDYCSHHDCIATVIQELLSLAQATGRSDVRQQAQKLLKEGDKAEVPCRHVPRKSATGSPVVPFA